MDELDPTYIGQELELFKHAKNWKNYWLQFFLPFVGSKVLEVGAGIGTTTRAFLEHIKEFDLWMSLEPDANLLERIVDNLNGLPVLSKSKIRLRNSYLAELNLSIAFDTVLYIDVLEHIKEDRKELELACTYLEKGGYLLILVPAHNFLFSSFDKSIGHYRRYNKRSLKEIVPESMEIKKSVYLDSIGIFSSLANRLFLHQQYPSLQQIKFWDNIIIPLSMATDKVLGFTVGKSLLLIASKSE